MMREYFRGITIFILGLCLCVVLSSQHICFIGTVYISDVESFRWVLPYEDPCVCTAVRLGGRLPYKPATGHYLEGLFLSEDSEEIHKFFDCSRMCDKPLGVEHGTPLHIQDDDFTASSVDQDGNWYSSASSARLNYKGYTAEFWYNTDRERYLQTPGSLGGWKPQDYQHVGSWIEVNLGRIVKVSGIITQGRDGEGDGSGTAHLFWVTRFKVMYGPSENSELLYVKSRDEQEEFNGNTAAYNQQVTNFFLEPVLAYSIRIYPVEWENEVVLRFELLGCLMNS